MDLGAAGSLVGTVTVAGGLLGTALGGLLADRLVGRTRNAYLALSAVSMLPAACLAAAALLVPDGPLVAAFLFLAQMFLWFYNGPINGQVSSCRGAIEAYQQQNGLAVTGTINPELLQALGIQANRKN